MLQLFCFLKNHGNHKLWPHNDGEHYCPEDFSKRNPKWKKQAIMCYFYCTLQPKSGYLDNKLLLVEIKMKYFTTRSHFTTSYIKFKFPKTVFISKQKAEIPLHLNKKFNC